MASMFHVHSAMEYAAEWLQYRPVDDKYSVRGGVQEDGSEQVSPAYGAWLKDA